MLPLLTPLIRVTAILVATAAATIGSAQPISFPIIPTFSWSLLLLLLPLPYSMLSLAMG
jgi:hypothetical protein